MCALFAVLKTNQNKIKKKKKEKGWNKAHMILEKHGLVLAVTVGQYVIIKISAKQCMILSQGLICVISSVCNFKHDS